MNIDISIEMHSSSGNVTEPCETCGSWGDAEATVEYSTQEYPRWNYSATFGCYGSSGASGDVEDVIEKLSEDVYLEILDRKSVREVKKAMRAIDNALGHL